MNAGHHPGGVRAYHERLVLAAIRQAGALSKAEIARTTRLSGQTATVIVNSLLEEGYLTRQPRLRRRVGRPVTPFALNPEGAFSLGLKIGRRSLEALLVDLAGQVVARRSLTYAEPLPQPTLARARATAGELLAGLAPAERRRVVGFGVAMPWMLHEWSDVLGLERQAIAAWQEIDTAGELESATGLPVSLYNDATAACAAEIIAGSGIDRGSALYVFLGTLVGGGVVFHGRLHRGAQGNAGALGSMPIPATGGPRQLLHRASLIDLERTLAAAGLPAPAGLGPAPAAAAESAFEAWRQRATPALTNCLVAAMSVIDFERVVIDGLLPPAWRARMVAGVAAGLDRLDRTGLSPVDIAAGSIGPEARVLGAALWPLIERFSPDADLLVKTAPGPDPEPGRPVAVPADSPRPAASRSVR